MDSAHRNMWRSGVLLALFALTGTAIVAVTQQLTRERIAASERAATIRTLHTLVPMTEHDNDLYADRISVSSPQYLGSREPLTVYRARHQDMPVAAILTAVAPDGYSGAIRLLVAVSADGSLRGVRIIDHHETPGLGDGIEAEKSPWVEGFRDKSLQSPDGDGWRVKKDGGIFDQFTGATITPRAVVRAVHNALLYFQANRDALFAPATHTEQAP